MKYELTTVLWSLGWALAFLASVYIFKGKPGSYWIDSAVMVGATTHILWRSDHSVRRR
ncbi:MAG: hypothetical protein ACRD5L_10585 [Bryobacteraceae bacterium]